jgi:hypothetical protein
LGDTLNDQTIDVVLVAEPLWALLVGLDVVLGVLHESVDLLAVVADVIKTWQH